MNKLEKIGIGMAAGLVVFGTTVFGTTGKVYNTSQGLVLRGAASKSGEPLQTVAEGAEVEILEDNGEWYKVNANGKEGYLFAKYVKVLEETTTPVVQETPTEESTDAEAKNITKIETKVFLVPAITSSVIGTIPVNTEVNVIKELKNWAYVSFNNVYGWIRTYSFNEITTEANVAPEQEQTPEQEQPTQAPAESVQDQVSTEVSFTKGYINSGSVNVRKEPNKSSSVVTTLILNTGVTITGQTDEWYRITYGDYVGYVYKPLISETPITTNRGGETRVPQQTEQVNAVQEVQQTVTPAQEQVAEQVPVETPVETNNSTSEGEKIAALAKQYIGYSYVYGGTSPSKGFDCSGFTYYIFGACGYSINRSASAQVNNGRPVSKSELQPGDIVLFNNTSNGSIGHVGIYIGDGRMVHAANSNRGVVTDTINSGYYNTYYYTARRIVN